jgi:hypothetical protein
MWRPSTSQSIINSRSATCERDRADELAAQIHELLEVGGLPNAPRMLDASDDEFLALCEHLSMLAAEGEALQTQAAEAKGLIKAMPDGVWPVILGFPEDRLSATRSPIESSSTL